MTEYDFIQAEKASFPVRAMCRALGVCLEARYDDAGYMPPRHPLIRFHGGPAPNSSWRKEVVPGQTSETKAEPQCLPALSPKQLLQSLEHDEPNATGPANGQADPWVSTPIDRATLLKRIYDIDALACECGGRLRFNQLVDEPSGACRDLAARGLPLIETEPRNTPPSDDRDFYDPQAPQPFAPQATGPPQSPSAPPADASPTIDDYPPTPSTRPLRAGQPTRPLRAGPSTPQSPQRPPLGAQAPAHPG